MSVAGIRLLQPVKEKKIDTGTINNEKFKILDEFNDKYPLISMYTTRIDAFREDYVGRDELIKQVLSTFMREEKSNVLVLGEAGSGKTTLVRALAKLDTERIYLEVDLPKIQANTTNMDAVGGQIKELATQVGNFCMVTKISIVLFFDEFHQFANMEAFKPFLALSGERNVRIISATTRREFDMYVAKNEALVERMFILSLPIANRKEVLSILDNFRKRALPDVNVDISVYDQIYELSERYIFGAQPRKSKDLLDQMIGIYRYTNEPISVSMLKDVLMYSRGIEVDFKVDPTSIKTEIDSKVYDQDYASSCLQDCLQASIMGLSDPDKPKGIFLFAGSTGSGKTEMAKQIARLCLGDAGKLITINMTNYSSAESAFSLREKITYEIYNHPNSVLLIDEIEKGDAECVRLFLPVLDEAKLEKPVVGGGGSFEQTVSFKNAYIVFTTNAGSEIITKSNDVYAGSDRNANVYNLRTQIKASLEKTTGVGKFPPELLGRIGIDNIIPFKAISHATARKIYESLFKKLGDTIKLKFGIELKFDNEEDVYTYLVNDRFKLDASMGGARQVKTVFDSEVVSAVAKTLGSVSDLSVYNAVEISVPKSVISYTDKTIVNVSYKAITCRLAKLSYK